MYGRRERSVSNHRVRGERRENDINIALPLQQENPFKGQMNIPLSDDIAFISPSGRLQRKAKQKYNTPQHKVQLDSKLHNKQNRMNTDVNFSNISNVLHPTQPNPNEIKRKCSLSFTSYPTPYKSKPEHRTTSLLSQTQAYQQHKKYQRSHSQPPNNRCYDQRNMEEKKIYRNSHSLIQNKSPSNTEMPIGQVPPPKPRRTFATEARIENILNAAINREFCVASQNQNCFLQTLV
jgi:hypothetical protein